MNYIMKQIYIWKLTNRVQYRVYLIEEIFPFMRKYKRKEIQ